MGEKVYLEFGVFDLCVGVCLSAWIMRFHKYKYKCFYVMKCCGLFFLTINYTLEQYQVDQKNQYFTFY